MQQNRSLFFFFFFLFFFFYFYFFQNKRMRQIRPTEQNVVISYLATLNRRPAQRHVTTPLPGHNRRPRPNNNKISYLDAHNEHKLMLVCPLTFTPQTKSDDVSVCDAQPGLAQGIDATDMT